MFKNKMFSLSFVLGVLLVAVLACVNFATSESSQPAPKNEVTRQADHEVIQPEEQTEAQERTEPAIALPAATAMSMQSQAAKMGAAPDGALPLAPHPTLAPPNGQPYQDNFFENYGVNPFVDTEDDHLSTFALDVDTGSYTITRRFLREGNLPDKDAVRVEEFVNYFPQGYRYPSERQAFAIYMDGAPSPFTESEKYRILRVGVQGYAVERSQRRDAALTFVIDISGSMDMENRLGLVKQALELLVEQLRPSDTVSIVVYGSEARVVLKPTRGDDQGAILEAIHSLQPEGATNAQAGLNLGYQMALRAFNSEGINRVILCSDGVANVGDTSAEDIWQTVKARASEGITLTTVGFGMGNYNDVLMEQLADNGDGFYAYVDTKAEARRLFVENLTSTLQVIGMNAKIQVDFNPQTVARYRLVGFENRAIADEDFRDNKVDAGEIGAGHAVTALYEIKLKPEANGEVASAHLRWEDPQSHTVHESDRSIFTEEFAQAFHDASLYFQRDVVVAEFAEILRHSYWAQSSSLAAVLEEAEWLDDRLVEEGDQQEFIDLVRQASQLMAHGL
jgi:Ca-activated chloride channel family protein